MKRGKTLRTAFQKLLDNYVERNQLQNPYLYHDDWIIRGQSKKEHDKNVNALLLAAKKRVTLNMDKCQICLNEKSMLVHIVSAVYKRPDRERPRALKENSFPGNSKAMRHLTGLFAYNAKWVSQNSSRVEPLLGAQRQWEFTLSYTVMSPINDKKSQIADACLMLPLADAGHLLLETDPPR